MVSRENKVIVGGIALAFAVGGALSGAESVPDWWAYAAFLVVGTVVPIAINEYLDRKNAP